MKLILALLLTCSVVMGQEKELPRSSTFYEGLTLGYPKSFDQKLIETLSHLYAQYTAQMTDSLMNQHTIRRGEEYVAKKGEIYMTRQEANFWIIEGQYIHFFTRLDAEDHLRQQVRKEVTNSLSMFMAWLRHKSIP